MLFSREHDWAAVFWKSGPVFPSEAVHPNALPVLAAKETKYRKLRETALERAEKQGRINAGKGKKSGAFVYENKNDNTLLVIPVEMDSINEEIIDYAFEWMRTVYKAYKDDKMPVRPWKQTSPNCAKCTFFDACWAEDAPEGDIKIKPMVVHKW